MPPHPGANAAATNGRPRANAVATRAEFNAVPGANGQMRQRRNAMLPKVRPDEAFHDDARLGVVYLFAHMEPSSKYLGVASDGLANIGAQGMATAGKAIMSGVAPVSKTMLEAVEKVSQRQGDAPDPNATEEQHLLMSFKNWCKSFWTDLKAEFKTKFGKMKFWVPEIKGLITMFVRFFASEAAPFVGGAFNIVKGLYKAGKIAIKRVRVWLKDRTVHFVPGHPAAAVTALKKSMRNSIGDGLFTALKGGMAMAVTAATAGVGEIVNMAAAFGEACTRLLWRLYEVAQFAEFCGWCRKAWAVRNTAGAPHTKVNEFTHFYSKFSMAVPAIAALTLNSGICGPSRKWIELYSPEGVFTGHGYDEGNAALKELKGYATYLLDNLGFDINGTSEQSRTVLKSAKGEIKQEDKAKTSYMRRVLKFTENVVSL